MAKKDIPPATLQRGPAVGSSGDMNLPIGELTDDEIIDLSGLTQGGSQESPSYIGVPDDYVAETTKTKTVGGWGKYKYEAQVPVTPRYTEGMEYDPENYSPDVIADLQVAMVDAGLLRKDGFVLGRWEASSVAAYAELLGYANRLGLDWKSALTRYGKSQPAEGKYAGYGASEDGGDERAPLLVQVSNPDYIKALLEDSSVRVIGRRLRPEEADRFVSAFQQLERQSQQQEHALAETGGEMVDPPSPTTEAENFLKQNYAAEEDKFGLLNTYRQFMDFI